MPALLAHMLGSLTRAPAQQRLSPKSGSWVIAVRAKSAEQ